MQKNIQYYEKLIQEKRKKTLFRDFVKELGSWDVLNIYKRDGRICRYPESDRIKKMGDTFWEESGDLGKEYDPAQWLFSNLRRLQDTIPMQYTLQFGANENCDYMDGVFLWKNVYLSFIIGFQAENILYSAFSYVNISNVLNSFLVAKDASEIFCSHGVTESYKVFYSKNIANASNIWFSTNLIGCSECIWCDNLENASYYINNTKYSKEAYLQKKEEILKDKKSFEAIWNHIRKNKIINFASENVSGIGIIKSSNIENGLWVTNMHHSRNIAIGNGDAGSKNIIDGIDVGVNAQNFYWVTWAWWTGSYNAYCSMQLESCSNTYYCAFMQACDHCLGCIWLKNKSYCILNTQYTKEEWEKKACEIFASMEADGTLGQFFPPSMNPFYFNDTLAYLIDDTFTKEEVEKEGYLWRDEPIRADIPEWMKIIKNTELDQFQGYDTEWNWNIDPEVLKAVISDAKWNYYRIVKMEYEFLMKHSLPLPTMHWLDRMKMGFR
jgi:hypothetical protein